MPKIKHVTRIFGDLSELDEIPSEFIEPYLVTYMSMVIESVGFGFDTPAEARERLKGIERFISIFGGIHARLATQNRVYDFCNMSDEKMIEICKQVCETQNNES
jgi:hypothetical protein